ncbi:MAG: ATP synthase F1 subunit epsilon [Prevotella sp.]|nr:ATP synthase F1 subunit epsilon [Prevotella sp.]MDD7336554.1 ATP synthase F1 subunit epsilon [Prevotella sp.]MDY4625119.1 ATP synthase F1 subunit epsilon [Prevotella sp.]MDY5258522.1 ATP synthase F1 subunit epsilon [Prevotella sp.]MDY6270708.1 ATP synthase F1 subunit epsilon [Prevotella sp.]
MLNLKIVSPEKTVFKGDVESVLVPGTAGEFEILTDHAPIISTLSEGRVQYSSKEGKKELQIHGGFVEVRRNEVSLCVEM